MPKSISDIDERHKERLIASVFQNINSALPHIERYYEDWHWKNEDESSPAELLSESWEDMYAFLSGELPQKFLDDPQENLSEQADLIEGAVRDLNKNRQRHQGDSLQLIEHETQLPSSI